MTHTPGPWKVCVDKRRIRATSEFWDGAVIADVKDTNWRYRDDDTVEANARLIAAAPALLEALEAMLSCCTDDRCEDAIKAEDAIALAKGEEVTA